MFIEQDFQAFLLQKSSWAGTKNESSDNEQAQKMRTQVMSGHKKWAPTKKYFVVSQRFLQIFDICSVHKKEQSEKFSHENNM